MPSPRAHRVPRHLFLLALLMPMCAPATETAPAVGASETRAADDEADVAATAPTGAAAAAAAAAVTAYFAAPSTETRRSAVAAIGASGSGLPDVASALAGAELFEPLPAGRREIVVAVGHGRGRRVLVRIPRGYRPDRAWPLLLTYHPSGGAAEPQLSRTEQLLGGEADRYVIASPHHYRQTVLDHPPPASSEHAEVIRSLKELARIDSDRVYVTGYSLGGYTAWTLAFLEPDHFAAAIPMAGTLGFPPDVPGLWEAFLPNIRHLPILSVWGGRDSLNVPGLNGRRASFTMSGLNRDLAELLEEEGYDNVVQHMDPRRGHGGVAPPRKLLHDFLSRRRVHYPPVVEHRFRYVHQARAYWLEGHAWRGAMWDRPWPPVTRRQGESEEAALQRTLFELLGRLHGEVDGQTIRVESTHLADLTVWIGDGMIDWQRPVTVEHDGRTVFTGRLEPDPGIALAQALRTRDFARLRWAGVRIDPTRGTARPITADESLPPVLVESTH